MEGGAGKNPVAVGTGHDIYLFQVATAVETDTLMGLPRDGTDRLDFATQPAATLGTGNLVSGTTLVRRANRIVTAGVAGLAANFEDGTATTGDPEAPGSIRWRSTRWD